MRVRIPFKRPDPAEEGEDDPEKSKEEVKKEEAPLEEIEYIDQVMLLNPVGPNYNVYIVHQLAQRFLREHIAKCFKDYLPELQVLDEEEMLTTVEREAEVFEHNFFKNCYPEVPVFDFELN